MAEDKNKYVLSINGMSKSFGRNKVLNHINLNVRPGTIMGLMGENGAGKSTMMKCLFGTYQKDEGTIILDGKEVNFSGPKDALEKGVAMVHQELNQCLERSVIDNMFLGRYPKNSLGMIDEGRMRKETSDLFRKLGITVNLTQPMKKMSVSQRQMCEIAKAISYHSKVIVLDEPTSSLTAPEVAKLSVEVLRKYGLIPVMEGADFMYYDKEEYTDEVNWYASLITESLGDKWRPIRGNEDCMRINKISAKMTAGCDAEAALSILSEYYDIIRHEGSSSFVGNTIELVPKGFNKAVGIAAVIRLFDIPWEDTIVFGDSNNDLAMFEYAATKVAMGNASPKIKELADYVTSDMFHYGIRDGLKYLKLI